MSKLPFSFVFPPKRAPVWAQEILEQQRQNTEELWRLKSGLAEKSMSQSASNSFSQASSTQPEFHFEGNKRQHEVNRSVIGHLDRALEAMTGVRSGVKLAKVRNC